MEHYKDKKFIGTVYNESVRYKLSWIFSNGKEINGSFQRNEIIKFPTVISSNILINYLFYGHKNDEVNLFIYEDKLYCNSKIIFDDYMLHITEIQLYIDSCNIFNYSLSLYNFWVQSLQIKQLLRYKEDPDYITYYFLPTNFDIHHDVFLSNTHIDIDDVDNFLNKPDNGLLRVLEITDGIILTTKDSLNIKCSDNCDRYDRYEHTINIYNDPERLNQYREALININILRSCNNDFNRYYQVIFAPKKRVIH